MMDKPNSGKWNSIGDALNTFYSFSKVTKGSGPKSGTYSMSDQDAGSSRIGTRPDFSEDQNPSGKGEATKSDEEIDDTTLFGGGRGKYLQSLQKQFARQELDETIHNELKMIFGTGFSNEAIESYHASVCSSPCKSTNHSECDTQETGVFSDVDDNVPELDIVVGESSIMKKISAHEKCSVPIKKKSPRCRNAIVLNLTQKKTSTDTEQDTKKVPELKGPDLFLPNKSYSNIVSASNSSNFNQADGPMFDEKDFPAL